jgi:ABC-2 type transport system permease protein
MAQFVPSTPAIDGLVRISQMGARLPDVAMTLWHLWALTAGLGLFAVLVEVRQSGVAPVQTRPLPAGLAAS